MESSIVESPYQLHVLCIKDGPNNYKTLLSGVKQRLCRYDEKIVVKCLFQSTADHLEWNKTPEWSLWTHGGSSSGKELSSQGIEDLVTWADILLMAPVTADTIAKMLHGIADNPILCLLRSWDVSKKILLIPGMSTSMWENPMTKKHLSKIRRKWKWVHLLEPTLWSSKNWEKRDLYCEDSIVEAIRTIENELDLLTLGHELDSSSNTSPHMPLSRQPNVKPLPVELWSIILDYLGDWEVAKTLGIYSSLPTPAEWHRSIGADTKSTADIHKCYDLDYMVLTGQYNDIVRQLEASLPMKWLPRLSVKLILKFARTDILSYLETHRNGLFWSTFGHKLLPTKASANFGQIAILDWWRTSPSFLTKEYDADAIDGASKAGFIHVLDWWRHSGLPLRYTEAALEQASSKGNIAVLEWWTNAASTYPDDKQYHIENEAKRDGKQSKSFKDPKTHSHHHLENPFPLLRPKIGKSLIFAAQNDQAATLHWWASSDLPTPHEDSIARVASAFGHVRVLDAWKTIKGDKMQFDNQVLVGATKNGHAEVLEWWKQSGFRVEYKTCDVEEALEDCLGGDGEGKVRSWWAKNGLNLGVGTSEWMKVKVL